MIGAELTLRLLATHKAPVSKYLDQIQKWIDDDWESHDVNQDAVRLIQKLVDALRVNARAKESRP